MSFNVCDKVKVVRQSCCYGLERNTICQVIKVEEEQVGTIAGKTRTMYLCYPISSEGQQVALWHCDSCLELVESSKLKENKDEVKG